MRRKMFGLSTVLVLLVAMAQPASAAIHKVLDSRAVRELGFATDRNGAGDVVRAWAQDSPEHPYRFQVYYKVGHDAPVRRTGVATDAGLGGLDLDNPLGAILSYNPFNRNSGYDVRLYDVFTEQAVTVPAGVNTNNQETHPTISGDYLLFQRGTLSQGSRRVILFNTQTMVSKTIVVATPNGIVFGDQVNGDYVVYTVCPASNRCVVRRYQISSDTSVKLPNANRAAYSPTVLADGTVYYAIGHPTRCGINTQIHKWTGGVSAPKLEQLSDGIDVPATWAFERLDASVDVFFTRLACHPRGAFRSGIYSVVG